MKAKDIKKVVKDPQDKERIKRPRVFKPKNFDGEKAFNPFINSNFKIPVTRETINIGLFKIDKDGKQVSAEKEIFREHQKYVKIYTDITYDEQDEEGNRIVLSGNDSPSIRKDRAALSAKALHLLDWISQKLDYGKDYVFIDREAYKDEGDVGSINTLKGAVIELIDSGFIAYSSAKNIYWINPFYMFKGDRVAKFDNNKVIVYDDTVEARKQRRKNNKEQNV